MALTANITTLAIIAAVIVVEVFCEDVSYMRQPLDDNWLKSPSSIPSQKESTTPWPTLGQGRNLPNYNILSNPTWVRSGQQQQHTHYANRGTSSNFNVGARYENSEKGATASSSSSNEVRDDELRDFSEALLNKDVNNAAQYVTINLQSKTTSRSVKDEAPLPLLTIDAEAFKIPSIEKIFLLHDNYIVKTNVNEQYTAQEKNEENSLLDTIIGTSVMQHTKKFLLQKGLIGADPKQFKDLLRGIWFDMYARAGGRIGSSGFEHVFLAEIKNNQVSGLHNWLYFNEEERSHQANYLGYMKKLDLGDKGAILKFHFTFHGINKPVGSMFIGTSPEFEMALYTTCFLTRADKICPLKLNGHRFVIRTFTYRYQGKNMIGSAFADI